jgi:protease-4
MPLEADQAVDRRRLKRRLSIWRAAAVIAVAALAVVVVNRTKGTLSPFDRPHVELFRELRAIAAKKPVVAVMGTLAASGGYMTALGADHIVARDGTITGSIGVIMQTADVTGLLKKLGIEPEAIKSAPLKAVPSPLEPLTDEGREATRGLVLDMYDMFVTMVADRRGLDADVAKKLADGRVYTGRQALAARLIDEIGGEDEARAWLESAKGVPVTLPISDVRIEKENKDLLGLVGGSLGKALFSERLTLDGLLVLWHP